MNVAGEDMRGGNVAEAATIDALLAEARALGVARLDAELVVAHGLGESRTFVLTHGEHLPAVPAAESVRSMLARRAAGEPLAYLTGRREFWSLELEVTRDTLVPRPETERLVEVALELVSPAHARIADLGTGSGAIALALAHERPAWDVLATDASAAALKVATRNARRLGLANVRFATGRWFDALVGEPPFDLIVSNPPYVAATDPALRDLAHEPLVALASGPEGLDDLRAIIAGAPGVLRKGACLALEHGADQADAVGDLLRRAPWNDVRLHKDLAGRPRITTARFDDL